MYQKILLILLVFLLPAGVAQSQPEPVDTPEPEMRSNRILSLPVYDMHAVYGENFNMQGPLSGKVFTLDEVDPSATDFVRTTISSILEKNGSYHMLLTTAKEAEVMIGLTPVAGSRAERIALIQKTGERVGADSVLCTYIYAFRNRVGSAYGVERPTMVSFEMNLVSVATGRIVWQRDFTETQQTLNENLLKLGKFLQRKGRWVTAQEMAAKALEDILASLP